MISKIFITCFLINKIKRDTSRSKELIKCAELIHVEVESYQNNLPMQQLQRDRGSISLVHKFVIDKRQVGKIVCCSGMWGWGMI